MYARPQFLHPETLKSGSALVLGFSDACCDDAEACEYLNTWTPKVCRLMAFWAIFRDFGPLFYLLWGLGSQKQGSSELS